MTDIETVNAKRTNLKIDPQVIIKVIADEVGKIPAEILMRVEAVEDALDGHRKLKFAIHEWQNDRQRDLDAMAGEIGQLRHTITCLQAEIDLVKGVMPVSSVRTGEVMSLVRSLSTS